MFISFYTFGPNFTWKWNWWVPNNTQFSGIKIWKGNAYPNTKIKEEDLGAKYQLVSHFRSTKELG